MTYDGDLLTFEVFGVHWRSSVDVHNRIWCRVVREKGYNAYKEREYALNAARCRIPEAMEVTREMQVIHAALVQRIDAIVREEQAREAGDE